jgi:hypothetical protein
MRRSQCMPSSVPSFWSRFTSSAWHMSLKRVQSRSVHEAQLATYLKLSGLQLGLLINSNVVPIKYGIRRRVTSR